MVKGNKKNTEIVPTDNCVNATDHKLSKIISQEIEKEVSTFPKEKSRKIGITIENKLISVSRQSSYVGPLPPPDFLRDYNTILPNAAERIFKIFENQAEHRQKIEAIVVTSNAGDSRRALWFAFIIFMTLIIGGFVLMAMGHSGLGIAAIISAVLSGTGIYIFGRIHQQGELSSKRQSMREIEEEL